MGGLEAFADRLCELTFDVQSTPELLRARESLQRIVGKLRVPGHGLVNQLAARATPEELGGSLGQALADRLRITKPEADRCIAEAADLGPRRALTGEPLAPVLAATAAAERDGRVGGGQVQLAVDGGTHTVYVINRDDATLSVIDGSTRTVTATVPVDEYPIGVAVDPGTHTVYVIGRDRNTVLVIESR